MYQRKKLQTAFHCLLFLLFAYLSVAAAATPPGGGAAGQTASNTAASKTPAANDKSGYAGSDSCKDCHQAETKSFETGPHSITTLNHHGGPGAQGCESCHGPGQAHIDAGGDVSKIISFSKLKSEDASKRCMTCHELGEEHANFLRSEHQKNNVGCLDCHSAHHPVNRTQLLKASEPMLCYGCHLEKKPEFSMPFHHRVNEGLVKCSDCHNPHGGFLTKQLRSTSAQDTVCFKCHAEKAGPFMFEHPPVKTEGCVACHTPHGSPNPRLLKRSQVNLLCLECHTFTVDSAAPAIPSFHNQAQKYQSCTLCHTQIHGSNFNQFFFK